MKQSPTVVATPDIYLANALSLNMFDYFPYATLHIIRVKPIEVAELISAFGTVINAIGHPSTDEVVRGILKNCCEDLLIPKGRRKPIRVDYRDALIIANRMGGRLPVGAEVDVQPEDLEFVLVQGVDRGNPRSIGALVDHFEEVWKDMAINGVERVDVCKVVRSSVRLLSYKGFNIYPADVREAIMYWKMRLRRRGVKLVGEEIDEDE